MKARLVDFLRCIHCEGTLQCLVTHEDPTLPWREIQEGHLVCDHCNQRYPIIRGIPRLLAGPLAADVEKTVSGFGWEWHKFDEQIQHTYMTDQANFLDFILPITPEFFRDKIVLDAGCGMGRFLKLGADFGSRDIIGVDLSDSVEVAYRHVRDLPNTHVVQADIMALPFRPVFDYIFSVGVLQFLAVPQAGFNQLVKLLNDEGAVSVWVYAQENNGWVIKLVSPVRRHITSRLPRPVLYGISHVAGALLYPCIQLLYKPINKTKSLSTLAKFLPYNEYLYYSSRLTYGALVSVVFDHLVPSLVTYVSREELESWFGYREFRNVMITSRNGMSWRARGIYTKGHSVPADSRMA